MKTNVLYYGDNLEILRNQEYFPNECVDLIYLDPPFSSKKNYNILFKEASGEWSEAQVKAFSDTWHWDRFAQDTYQDIILNAPLKVGKLIEAMVEGIGRSNDVTAYLVMMTVRLTDMHRVLKKTGSLYLHCDPTASHYLKLILDSIFGAQNFRNEIVWKRTTAHGDVTQGAHHFDRVHDVILRYSKGRTPTWNPQYGDYDTGYVEAFYRHVEPETGRRFQAVDLTARKPGGDTLYEWKGKRPYRGRYWAYSKRKMEQFGREGRLYYTKTGMPRLKYYLDEMPGMPAQDIWHDIPHALGKERLGYDTQKPLTLLERIVAASSDEEDVVLDPFCGCGTALVAAQKLNRRWIGIDITHLAIAVMKKRLRDSFAGIQFEVIGEPVDLAGAKALARQDRYQFQWWAMSLVSAQPLGDKKKGADKGIDGVISFIDERPGKAKRAVVQVKSGHVHVKDIRELKDVASRNAMGVFITLEPPTREMQLEAVAAGYYHSPLWDKDYPKIQILTVDELLHAKTVDMPPANPPFPKAQKISKKEGEQLRNM